MRNPFTAAVWSSPPRGRTPNFSRNCPASGNSSGFWLKWNGSLCATSCKADALRRRSYGRCKNYSAFSLFPQAVFCLPVSNPAVSTALHPQGTSPTAFFCLVGPSDGTAAPDSGRSTEGRRRLSPIFHPPDPFISKCDP